MNKLILCEGTTDAIFLSYYLDKKVGWKYCNRPPKEIMIKENSIEESINCYKKDDDMLLICGVGGKDRMKSFFEHNIKNMVLHADTFQKIAVILDKDKNKIESIEKHVAAILSPVITVVKNNKWRRNHYTNAYKLKKEIEMLLVVIPNENQGALETIMLDAISENPDDKIIVDEAESFVEKIRNNAARYIRNDRLELKAKLGVTWAIQYPEKTFKLMNEQIISVPWEKSKILNDCFSELIKI